jgi:GTP-binding protein
MDVRFVGSFASGSLPRPGYPEIAVGGRSNVGKSSFINCILGRGGVARVSSKPGRTRTLNFYLCGDSLMVVDLPGYGYSRAPKAEQRRWSADIDGYLKTRENLRGVILLGDIRHFPLASDTAAVKWLVHLGKPLLVVLTKADKLGAGAQRKRAADISGVLARDHVPFSLFSAKTGLGRKEVWNWIDGRLNA